MHEDFWLDRWQTQRIGFHQDAPNPLLAEHFDALSLTAGSRVFVPLCGKTLDMLWLRAQEYHVVGVELVETAVEQFFDENAMTPRVSADGPLRCYSADGLDVLVGDVFDLSAEHLGPVDGVYDRAALVALPEAMRTRYAAHLMALTACAPQLVVTFQYDQELMDGPPFSIHPDEIDRHYGRAYAVQHRARVEVPGGLKGLCPAAEDVWVLRRSEAA